MKTFRFLVLSVAAFLMSLNFISCNKEVVSTDQQEEKYIEVGLDCVGEILEIENSPLTKPMGVGNVDVYSISVYSLEEHIMEGGYVHYAETPYASGYFANSLQGVKIRLLEGKDYRFKVAVTIGTNEMTNSREFDYSPYSYMSAPTVYYEFEGYYGELDKYTPVEGGSVLINTKRVSYGVKFIAEDLTEGTINIKATSGYSSANTYSIDLTTATSTYEHIYSFPDTYSAWRGRWVDDKENNTGSYVNYYDDYQLNVNWTKADGSVIPLGVFNVTFERNVKTTVRIKAEETGASNGITVVREPDPMVDANKEYVISGGKVTEVPVNNA